MFVTFYISKNKSKKQKLQNHSSIQALRISILITKTPVHFFVFYQAWNITLL